MYNTDNWQGMEERKPGVKILYRLAPGRPTTAFFKYSQNPNGGPINANEFIASKLAERIDLPTPKVEFLNLNGVLGSISHIVPGDEPNPWSLFPYRQNLEEQLISFEKLGGLMAFDFWILNTDRNQDNLMFSKLPGEKKYNFYLIDHGHSLYGPSSTPPGNFEDFPLNILQISEIQELIKKGFDFMKPYIDTIENVKDDEIITLVNSIPSEFLSDGQKPTIIELLIKRRGLIRTKILELCNSV